MDIYRIKIEAKLADKEVFYKASSPGITETVCNWNEIEATNLMVKLLNDKKEKDGFLPASCYINSYVEIPVSASNYEALIKFLKWYKENGRTSIHPMDIDGEIMSLYNKFLGIAS